MDEKRKKEEEGAGWCLYIEIRFKIEDILKSLLLATRLNQTLELAVCVRLFRTLKIRLYTGQAGILLDSN